MARTAWQAFLRRFTAPAEDPRRMFPDAREPRVELLADVRTALGRLQGSQDRLAERAAELRGHERALDSWARRSLAVGDRAGAREAVSLHELAVRELEAVSARLRELEAATRRLSLDEQRLSARIEVHLAYERIANGAQLAELPDPSVGGLPLPSAVELRLALLERELGGA